MTENPFHAVPQPPDRLLRNWERAEIQALEFPLEFVGKPRSEVLKHFKVLMSSVEQNSLPSTYAFASTEYYDFLLSNPNRVPEVMKDGRNYYFIEQNINGENENFAVWLQWNGKQLVRNEGLLSREWDRRDCILLVSKKEAKETLSKKILYADDDANSRIIYSTYLESLGYAVETVTNGQLALDKLNQNTYDLVMVDGKMPLVDGIQVVEHIHSDSTHKNTPVIVLSARHTLMDQIEKLGAVFMLKPVDLKDLKAHIESLLAKSTA